MLFVNLRNYFLLVTFDYFDFFLSCNCAWIETNLLFLEKNETIFVLYLIFKVLLVLLDGLEIIRNLHIYLFQFLSVINLWVSFYIQWELLFLMMLIFLILIFNFYNLSLVQVRTIFRVSWIYFLILMETICVFQNWKILNVFKTIKVFSIKIINFLII